MSEENGTILDLGSFDFTPAWAKKEAGVSVGKVRPARPSFGDKKPAGDKKPFGKEQPTAPRAPRMPRAPKPAAEPANVAEEGGAN